MANEISNSIDTFKGQFYGGTRPNRFEIVADLPGGGLIDTFHAYAFNLPEVSIGEIPVNYRGRTVYIPGDRDYNPWTITILDDRSGTAASIWFALQDWQNKINDHQENVSAEGFASGNRGEWTVKHLDHHAERGKSPGTLKEVKLVGCWLTNIGPIQMNAAEKNALVTFTATVRYDYIIPNLTTATSQNGKVIGQETFPAQSKK